MHSDPERTLRKPRLTFSVGFMLHDPSVHIIDFEQTASVCRITARALVEGYNACKPIGQSSGNGQISTLNYILITN